MEFPLKTIAGQVTAYLTMLVLVAFWITAGAPRNWAVMLPDTAHTYGIRVRSGVDLFFRPSVGWFIEHGLWVCLGLAVATVVAEVTARLMRRPDDEQTETD